MKAINSDEIVTLAALIMSEEIEDRTLISVFDPEGKLLARGCWYEDKMLAYSERIGRARQADGSRIVSFQLI